MIQLSHPDEVKNLDYFSFRSLASDLCLHPGGIEATITMLKNIPHNNNAKLLEIGCGCGFTTVNLLNANYNLTSCDVSSEMVNSASYNAQMNGYPFFNATLGSMTKLPFNTSNFDIAFFEAVAFFVDDINLGLKEIHRVLKDGGYVGFVDMHYTSEPPEQLKEELCKCFGVNSLNFLTKTGWNEVLSEFFEPVYWESRDLSVHNKINYSHLDHFVKIDKNVESTMKEEILNKLKLKQQFYENIFNDNRAYLNYHIGVYKKK